MPRPWLGTGAWLATVGADRLTGNAKTVKEIAGATDGLNSALQEYDSVVQGPVLGQELV
jgi:hypothetical protein